MACGCGKIVEGPQKRKPTLAAVCWPPPSWRPHDGYRRVQPWHKFAKLRSAHTPSSASLPGASSAERFCVRAAVPPLACTVLQFRATQLCRYWRACSSAENSRSLLCRLWRACSCAKKRCCCAAVGVFSDVLRCAALPNPNLCTLVSRSVSRFPDVRLFHCALG